MEPKIEEDQLGDMLANMTSGENSELSKLVNVGDSQAALRMAGAVNSLLNAQSSKTPSNDTGREDARKEKRKAVNMSLPFYIACVAGAKRGAGGGEGKRERENPPSLFPPFSPLGACHAGITEGHF